MASQDIDMPLILAPARGCGWAILLSSGLYFCGLGDRFLFTCRPRGVAERRAIALSLDWAHRLDGRMEENQARGDGAARFLGMSAWPSFR